MVDVRAEPKGIEHEVVDHFLRGEVNDRVDQLHGPFRRAELMRNRGGVLPEQIMGVLVGRKRAREQADSETRSAEIRDELSANRRLPEPFRFLQGIEQDLNRFARPTQIDQDRALRLLRVRDVPRPVVAGGPQHLERLVEPAELGEWDDPKGLDERPAHRIIVIKVNCRRLVESAQGSRRVVGPHIVD